MPPDTSTGSGWIPYFGVDDVEQAVRSACDRGGTVYVGPMPVPAGTIAVLDDPQGAVFALWNGRFDD